VVRVEEGLKNISWGLFNARLLQLRSRWETTIKC